MRHRPRDTRLPILGIRSEKLYATIRVRQLEHAAERAFLPDHSHLIRGRDNLVGPPSRGDLRRKDVLRGGIGIERGGYIIGERSPCLRVMGKAGFQYLVPDQRTIYINVVHAQGGSHPPRTAHLLGVFHGRDEPTGAIGRPCPVENGVGHHRRIYNRNPGRGIPRLVVQRVGPINLTFLLFPATRKDK